jgi:signal transduction histidine kinase
VHEVGLAELALSGLAANLVILVVAGVGLALTVPADIAGQATLQLVLPSVLVNPVATALLGGLLRNRVRARRLIEANERLQAEVEARLAEVRASRARIVAAGYEERKRVERDIHDGAQQRLVGLVLTLRLLRSRLGSDVAPEVEAALDQASTDARAALAELRELARGIHPQILTEAGIGPAIESVADRAPVPVRVSIEAEGRYDAAIESAAYFVVSEALTNVAKYAEATEASVRVAEVSGNLRIEVRDDGVGGADPSAGTGLRGLADRLAAIDATLDVVSPAGGGTTLIATIPLGARFGPNSGITL